MVKKFHDCGFVFEEIPVHHYHRTASWPLFNVRRLVPGMFRLWFESCCSPAGAGGVMSPEASEPTLSITTSVFHRLERGIAWSTSARRGATRPALDLSATPGSLGSCDGAISVCLVG
jgi:hypothetical protein